MTNNFSNHKKYLWITFVYSIIIKGNLCTFEYKGGTLTINFKDIHSIMFYGYICPIQEEFIRKCSIYSIPITIHYRNIDRPTYILPSFKSSKIDILTKQILYRQNIKKRTYIAKRLLKAKFESMTWLIPVPFKNVYKVTDLKSIINIEALHAKRYWKKYYELLESPLNTRRGKYTKNNISKTLDGISKFISGIILRWIVYHNLSPYHAFIHLPTEYAALVYDLMEPYRGFIDKLVFDTIKECQSKKVPEKEYLQYSIENLKEFMDTKVYVNTTRQIVTFQELYHGCILALRSYLIGELSNCRFIVPMPSKPNGGRPIKVNYKLYGREAGITNFNNQALEVSKSFKDSLEIKD